MKLFVATLLFFMNFSCFADDISPPSLPPSLHISYLHQHIADKQLKINSQVMFRLSSEMKKALEHEIPLTFDVELRILEKNSFLGFNYEKVHHDILFQISLLYFNYSKQFIISNKRNQSSQKFNSLDSALRTFGTLYNFKIMDLNDFDTNKEYSIAFRVKFNRWHLPTPLIIDSFLEASWYLSSDWHKAPIQDF